MSIMIPKQLFMIWFGDNIPNYVQFSINAYKEANPDFIVKLIYFSIKNIEDIYNGKINSIYDKMLNEVIFDILNKNEKYKNILNKTYMYILQHQEVFYGKEIRFIQLLSDIYRLRIIQEFGGIYVDCDTFPLKPFDNQLLQLGSFIVNRHYNNNASNNVADDNYFFGSISNSNIQNSIKLLQTNDKWWSNIQYLINKKKFYELKFKYVQQFNQLNYIEHYFDGNWKNKNGRIRTPKCFLDVIYAR